MDNEKQQAAGPVPAPSGAGEGLAAVVRGMRGPEAARSLAAVTAPGAMRELLCAFADQIEEEAKAKEWALASLLADNEALRAALAAPRRNCDRFATWEEAKAAYWREQGDPCDWRRLGGWLFAPA